MVRPKLRRITGWALLVGSVGIFIDAWASWSIDASSPSWLVSIVTPGGGGNGSIGLIPAYLGTTIGLIGLFMVIYRLNGMVWAILAGAGVLAILVFWYSYPLRATVGGLGGLVLSVVVLTFPFWGRLASPFWAASSIMGIPELVTPGRHWGPVAGFTLLGAAIGVTGAFLLWGLGVSENAETPIWRGARLRKPSTLASTTHRP